MEDENAPPTRKAILCYALRRLARTRCMQPALEGIKAMSELVSGEWCDLSQQGTGVYSAEITQSETEKYRQRMIKKRVLMKMQARIGMGTMQDAFSHWKEKTYWASR